MDRKLKKKIHRVMDFSKEVQERPTDLSVGYKCIEKSTDVNKKAQDIGVPWEQIWCFSEIEGSTALHGSAHAYSKIAGKTVDIAGDSEVKKIFDIKKKDIRYKHEFVSDKYFSNRHSWSDILSNISFIIREHGGRTIDMRITRSGGYIIIVFDDVSFSNDIKKEIIDVCYDLGVGVSFIRSKNGSVTIKFKQTGVDKSLTPSNSYALIDLKTGQYRNERLKPMKNKIGDHKTYFGGV